MPVAPPEPPHRALERRELAERREATRRAVQRNASQARGELRRNGPRRVLEITGLMLRGKSLRTIADPQVPLVFYRGRAFEELGDQASAMACYQVLAAWDGGPSPLVDDARPYIERGLRRLMQLHGEPPTTRPAIPPERDPRVFPRPYLTAGRLILAVAAFMLMLVCAGILLAVLPL